MWALLLLLSILAAVSAKPLDSTSCRTNGECLRKGLPLLKPRRPRSSVPLAARAANDFTTGCTSSVVSHTITTAGTYLVSIAGGAGGASYTGQTQTVPLITGGRGAEVNATYTLPAGFTFTISVGCNPDFPRRYGPGGGGGGTFITSPADTSFLQVAGGGGGAAIQNPGADAGTTGVASLAVGNGGDAPGLPANRGTGGTNGNGGKAGRYDNDGFFANAAGGAGSITNGEDGPGDLSGEGGKSGPNGYAGGAGNDGGVGGYGGGGGGGGENGGGGGGSGGGGGGAYDGPGRNLVNPNRGQQSFGGGFGGSFLGSSPAYQPNTATLRPFTTGNGFFSLYYLGQ